MAAAAVMRGEADPSTLEYQLPEDGEVLWHSCFASKAALPKVCGTCDYGDDISLKMPPEPCIWLSLCPVWLIMLRSKTSTAPKLRKCLAS